MRVFQSNQLAYQTPVDQQHGGWEVDPCWHYRGILDERRAGKIKLCYANTHPQCPMLVDTMSVTQPSHTTFVGTKNTKQQPQPSQNSYPDYISDTTSQRQNKNRSRAHKHHSNAHADRNFNNRLQFKQGSRRFLKRISPNHQQLSTLHDTQNLVQDSHLYRGNIQDNTDHIRLMAGSTRESIEMNRTLALLTAGGTGHIPTHKSCGYVRSMFENWNSLGIFTHSWKLDRINHLIQTTSDRHCRRM